MAHNNRDISKVIYNDRYGYAIAYYEPHMRDPALEIMERAKRINLPTTRKFKPEPTRLWKLRETPREFLERKDQEREIELLHDTCDKAKSLFRKARDFDYNRHEMLFPKYKNSIDERGTVDEVITRVNDIYEKYLNKSRLKKEVTFDTPEEELLEEERNPRPASVIVDSHRKFEHLMSKRREDAENDIRAYAEAIDKIYRGIDRLTDAFKDEK